VAQRQRPGRRECWLVPAQLIIVLVLDERPDFRKLGDRAVATDDMLGTPEKRVQDGIHVCLLLSDVNNVSKTGKTRVITREEQEPTTTPAHLSNYS